VHWSLQCWTAPARGSGQPAGQSLTHTAAYSLDAGATHCARSSWSLHCDTLFRLRGADRAHFLLLQLALQQDGLLCVSYVTKKPSAVTLIMPDGSSEPLSTFLPKCAPALPSRQLPVMPDKAGDKFACTHAKLRLQ
jgi:hypothetical protein